MYTQIYMCPNVPTHKCISVDRRVFKNKTLSDN